MPILSSRDLVLSTAAAMLHSSIVRSFTLRIVGCWLTLVMLYPSSVVLTVEAICAAALVVAIVFQLMLQLNADRANKHR